MTDRFQPALMTIAEFSRWSRLGRTKIYEEIGAGALRTFTIGRRRYVKVAEAHAWLDRQIEFASSFAERA